MPQAFGQFGPLRQGVTGERESFVLALRELWQRWAYLGISVRSYAQQEAIHPASVSRYFNGGVLPAEEFVLDLVDAIQQKTGLDLADESERLRRLLRGAVQQLGCHQAVEGHGAQNERPLRCRVVHRVSGP